MVPSFFITNCSLSIWGPGWTLNLEHISFKYETQNFFQRQIFGSGACVTQAGLNTPDSATEKRKW